MSMTETKDNYLELQEGFVFDHFHPVGEGYYTPLYVKLPKPEVVVEKSESIQSK